VEHAAIAILPLFAMCDRNDIGGVSTPFHIDTGKAQIFIYDGYPGGIGIAEKGYEIVEGLWAATLKTIEECPCREGCPACIQSPKCGNNNEPLDKKAAVILLRGLLNVLQ
jgi:DEAD/DEAH box helicase domain-containing protein